MSKDIRILVAGSQRFDRPSFGREMLELFDQSFHVGSIVTGPFSGADEVARKWAEEKRIKCEMLNIPEHERMELRFFDARRVIPPKLFASDPLFARGFHRMRDSGANALVLLPAPDGSLGPTCACLERMAQAISMPVFNCATLISAVENRMRELLAINPGADATLSDPASMPARIKGALAEARSSAHARFKH